MLSLVAGGAIDDYILSQLRALRQEHQLARLIHSLQISLWPGGLWFQRLPERQAAVITSPYHVPTWEAHSRGNTSL